MRKSENKKRRARRARERRRRGPVRIALRREHIIDEAITSKKK